jgi:hypothetical protein
MIFIDKIKILSSIMSKKIKSIICALINDGLHYLIGLVIVAFIIYAVIQLHNHFSKDNIPIKVSNKKISSQNQQQGQTKPISQ